MEFYETCNHEIVDGACIHCGLMMESYIDEKLDFSSNCPQISGGKNNILDNLEGIPEDVVARAKSNITERENATGKKVRNDKGYTLKKKMEDKGLIIENFYNYKGDKRTLLNNAIEGELGLAILESSQQEKQFNIFKEKK